MASSSSSSVISGVLSSTRYARLSNHGLHTINPRPSLILPRVPITHFTLTFARRKNSNSAVPSSKKKKKKSLSRKANVKDDDSDEDAFEALFNQLEEDLKNDVSDDDSDDELTEEDLRLLEKELEETIGDEDELAAVFASIASGSKGKDDEDGEDYVEDEDDEEDDEDDEDDEDEEDDEDDEEDDEDDEDDEEDDNDEPEQPVELKNWQLRRLAYALRTGRRKIAIKSLAAELGLDRALVLEMLRDPPPKLLFLSFSLPDKVHILEPETKSKKLPMESTEESEDIVEPEPKVNEPTVKEPVHARQSRWSAQKRLKKVQSETMERVYRRTKRPTNSMVSSIVHVTNLPKKRVIQWFEDKRAEDGIVDRVPYERIDERTEVNSS